MTVSTSQKPQSYTESTPMASKAESTKNPQSTIDPSLEASNTDFYPPPYGNMSNMTGSLPVSEQPESLTAKNHNTTTSRPKKRNWWQTAKSTVLPLIAASFVVGGGVAHYGPGDTARVNRLAIDPPCHGATSTSK